MKLSPCILLPLMIFASCAERIEDAPYTEKIVVEGFIEEGKGAVVWLAKTMYVPYGGDNYEREDLRNIPIRLATVKISDGEREEYLIGGRDTDHLFEYSYRGYDIKGRQGVEYTLTVIYSGYTLTAVTTIPAAAGIGEITVERVDSPDGDRFQVDTDIRGHTGDGYYMFMSKSEDGGIYYPCQFGTVEGASLGEDNRFTLYRPLELYSENGEEDYYPTYLADEFIMLRLASIDKPAYDFWNSYMNEVVNSRNPIYPSASNLKSNIAGGGLGIWYGFSSAYREIRLSNYINDQTR